jgi:hypothetical protein
VNVLAEVVLPLGVVTEMVPLDVPAAITAVISAPLTTVNDVAGVPPNETAVAPVRFAPVIVTDAPGPADTGANPETVGADGGDGGEKALPPPPPPPPPHPGAARTTISATKGENFDNDATMDAPRARSPGRQSADPLCQRDPVKCRAHDDSQR